MRKFLALAGILLFSVSCGDALLTDPRLTPDGPSADIDVSAARVELRLLYGGTALSSVASSQCTTQFAVRVDGKNVHSLCHNAAAVTLDLEPGDRLIQILAAHSGTELARATVSAVAGSTTPADFELSAVMGLVRGVLEIDGAAPAPWQYQICFGNMCLYPEQDGSFGALELPGSRTLGVRALSSSMTIGTAAYEVVAGATTDAETVAVTPSRLRIVLSYNGTAASAQSLLGSCQYQVYIGSRFARYLCGYGTVDMELPAGEHAIQVWSDGWATRYDATVTLADEETQDHPLELASRMGMVTGRLLVNGVVPTHGSYRICVGGNGCFHPSPDGTFRYLDAAGTRTRPVRSTSSNAEAGTFGYDVTAGQTTAVGDVDVGLGTLRVSLLYDGDRLQDSGFSPLQHIYLFVNNQFGAWAGTHVSTVYLNLPSTEQRIRVGLNGFGDLLAVDATPVTGDTVDLGIELSATVGVISGRLLINGQVPPARAYQICVEQGQGCVFTGTDGVFKYIDLPGARTAYVRSASSNTPISTFGYTSVAGATTIVGTTTGGAQGETATGSNITVTPVDANTGTSPATLTFTSVTGSGQTTVSTSPTGPQRPTGTRPGDPEVYYNIATTAEFTGEVVVCINYGPSFDGGQETRLALFHGEEDGSWTDVTTSQDTQANVICGTVTSLSPFYVAEVSDPPVPAISAPASADEGSAVAFDGSGSTDPDGAVALYEWDFQSDGTFDASGAAVTHAYPQDGAYTVTLRVTDSDGATASATHAIVVDNVAPTVTVSAPETIILEGGSAVAELSVTVSDPGADSHTAAVACGNGSGGTGALPSFACTFVTAGTYTIQVTVSDGTATGIASRTVAVQSPNRPPVAEFDAPAGSTEGGEVRFTNRSVDPDADPLVFAWDFEDDGIVDSRSAEGVHTYPDNGTFTIRLTASDAELTHSTTLTVSVGNVAPTAALALPTTAAEEGGSFTVALTGATDPSATDVAAGLRFAFDCGAGYGAFDGAASAVCAAPDDPAIAVRAAVRDKDGGVTEYTGSVPVANLAPEVGALSAPVDPVAINTVVAASAAYADAGLLDTHTGVLVWDQEGAGTQGAATVSGGRVSASYAYPAPGVYTLQAAVTDDAGATGVSPLLKYVVVYDPEAGFVTGGGWIDSPLGACSLTAECASVTGRAQLGFVARYQKGATVPSGKTDFMFQAAGLRFRSASYEWLVVAGARAQFKGVGTINGAGDYGFLLTAVDGQVNGGGGADRFRIKIWERNPDGSDGAVVYDNQVGGDSSDTAEPSTVLGGGSIVIHSR